ncbi:MAG: Amidase [Nitrospira sp.]|jgi:gamma-glutamylcyclotransferase (GGCT)/AIG2-like uncharacterized protein YtfP|nr:MAG: Amidase [Nitrospira sp.]
MKENPPGDSRTKAVLTGNSNAHRVSESDVLLAVNGTLMRGLELNPNMVAAKATFVREAMTEAAYRLWTINDEHPAMLRVTDRTGAKVAVEVWSVPAEGLAGILLNEPPGLCIGKVRLEDGTIVLGVLGESALVEGHREITAYRGWRYYLAQKLR